MPELCGMESSQMLSSGMWISATYLLKNKFNASNTLVNNAEYTLKGHKHEIFLTFFAETET